MLCDNCESGLRKNWKFCPTCGAEIVHEDIFISLGNVLKSITKEIESFEEPNNYSALEEPLETNIHEKRSRAPRKNNANIKEPKVGIKNLGNRIIFELKLPGADPDEVQLTELDESFEIKAHANNASYFKIITVPQGFSLSDQYFENDKLVLEFVA
ncbi:MAG: hypothetical protein HY515_02130 [Candidatus Aenigmarchaeota archaeon]|nr:hypothetical protein [Candidatus Aenigmarchaeota archaeon]